MGIMWDKKEELKKNIKAAEDCILNLRKAKSSPAIEALIKETEKRKEEYKRIYKELRELD